MAAVKRQGREKPKKIEQKKVRGPAWGPQVGKTALLANPVSTGQAWEEAKTHKERSQRARLSLLFASLGRHALTPHGCVFLLFSK